MTRMKTNTSTVNPDSLTERASQLGLWGLLTHLDEVRDRDWVEPLIDWEETERAQRSLDRRIRTSRISRYKPMADFNWTWPKKVDRSLVDDLFTFRFVRKEPT